MSAIHPTAFVDPAAELGRDVTIEPYAVVEAHTVVGDGARIGPHAVVHAHATVGPRTHLHAHAIVGGWPQDLAFDPATVSTVVIGADCVLREGVTVHRGTKSDSVTRLGDRCFLMANSHVAHNCTLGNQVIMANGALLGGYVEVQDQVFISGNCVVHQFCRIGRLAMMSGLSAVSKDVPPFCVVENSSTNTVAGLNVVGMRRGGISAEERLAIKRVYGVVYHQDLNTEQALQRLAEDPPQGPAAEMVAFIQASQRGICRHR